jgi:hypothetical protein
MKNSGASDSNPIQSQPAQIRGGAANSTHRIDQIFYQFDRHHERFMRDKTTHRSVNSRFKSKPTRNNIKKKLP